MGLASAAQSTRSSSTPPSLWPTSIGAAVVVIDLGEMPAATSDDQPLPPRSMGRRGRLSIVIAAIAVLVAGSAVPLDAGLPVVARIPIGTAAQLLVERSMAVVVDAKAGRDEITAYDLRSGQIAWSTPLGGDANNTAMFVDGSILVVETGPAGAPDEVEGFALATGIRRWTERASMVQEIPAGLLLYQQDSAGDVVLELFDPLAGRMHWRTSISDFCQTYLSSDLSRLMSSGLLEVCADSKELVAMDLTTGASRARTPLSLFPSPHSRHGVPYDGTNQARVLPRVVYIGEVTILAVTQYPALSLSAFRTSDLDPLWSGVPVTGIGRFYACGSDICVGAGAATTALDPGTGRHVPPPVAAPEVGPAGTDFTPLLATTATLVVVPAGQQPAPEGTGLAYFETPGAQGRPVSVEPPHAGSLWIAIQRGTSIQPVQFLRGIGIESCSVISTYLACTTASDRLTVWKLG